MVIMSTLIELEKKTDDELLYLNAKYLRKGGKPTQDNYRIHLVLCKRHGSFSVQRFRDLPLLVEDQKRIILKK